MRSLNSKMTSKIRLIILFIIATSSLLFAGNILNSVWTLPQILILQWCGLCGTIMIYYYDHYFVGVVNYKVFLKEFMHDKLRGLFILQFMFIALPLSIYLLPLFSTVLLACICLFGILYSAKFTFNGVKVRVKDIFLIKNILIGFNWGALILVGAGTIAQAMIAAVFLFTSLQIVIGSIVRDINDIEKDKIANMKTVPIVLSVKNTLLALHISNPLTILCGYLVFWNISFVALMGIIIVWKGLIIWNAGRNNASLIWCQTLNILICFGIFIILLIQHAYGSY